MAINLHEFTGEERVDTELAPLLNENFNALKDYADDASRWQILPVQFSGDNVKYLLQETSLTAANTTYVLPLIKIDDTNVASACDLRFIILKENGSINGISADIKLQKISSTNCAVNYSFTPSEDIILEPCTFTYNSVKYAGLKITVGADLPECIWANGFVTETWQDAIAYKSGETVSNNEINNSIQVLGSDMVLVANMFKHLQTDKSPVSDYDVVNKKSLNDLTNVKTYSALSQIGLSGDVLDFHPYIIGNALPANSMLIIGIGGDTNNYNYPVTMGNLTVVRANTNHVLFQIDQNDSNGYNTRYVLEYSIDTASVDSPTNWKQILTDIDTGYWQPNETVTRDTVRKLVGKQYAGCFLVCKVAGTTGSTQPSPDPADGAGIGGGSGSITFYSSLEEIGITPGQETFASIHSALPINSVLEYTTNNSHSLKPSNTWGHFRASKLLSLSNVTFFLYQGVLRDGTNNTGNLWFTYYNQESDNTSLWTQVAKQSDLTDLSNSVVKSVNGVKPKNGNVTIDAITTLNGTIVGGTADFNNYTESGNYYFTYQAHSHSPNGGSINGFLVVVSQGKTSGYCTQTFYQAGEAGNTTPNIYYRKCIGSTWSEWSLMRFVVQSYKSGTTWYRQYSDGWVEQGGIINNIGNETRTITLPKSMANTNYYCACTVKGVASTGTYSLPMMTMHSVSTTQVSVTFRSNNNNQSIFWQVIGQGA